MNLRKWLTRNMTSFRVILLGFGSVILLGAALLSLPSASNNHTSVPFLNALFTSVSATCVTGLVVYDTATQWSFFGKAVILILIQIGGLGVVTMSILLMLALGRRIGIFQRMAMQDAISAPQIGGIVRFTRFFLAATVIFEGAGLLFLMPPFIGRFGFWKGTAYALFHSVSAFCNAGFDLMGVQSEYSSFTHFVGDTWLNLVIMLLIIIGGLGYLTWQDLLNTRFRFRGLRLQSKIILSTSAVLILIPFLYFVLLEFKDMPLKERILASLFQSVTPRTAGFNTVSYGAMSETGQLITVVLMLIGGAPGSTAGGMKVTTIFALSSAARKNLRRDNDAVGFRRRLEPDTISNAFTLLAVYLWLLFLGTVAITTMEHLPVMPVMFECASALGTVGLSVGITPGLGDISKLILISFMFLGRVGGITIAYAMVRSEGIKNSHLPAEKITVG